MCRTEDLTGTLPNHWEWLDKAQYDGFRFVFDQWVEIWNATRTENGHTTHTAAGFRDNFGQAPTIPVFRDTEWRTSAGAWERRNVVFTAFGVNTPSANIFEVPKECEPKLYKQY